MTSSEFAKAYLSTAQKILKEAKSLQAEGVWHLVVRRSQEAVELALKALLRSGGVEIPRIHDVGILLKQNANRFPKIPIDQFISISRRLRSEREISFYGDDMTETPPEELYTEEDAQQALADATEVLSCVSGFI